MNKRVRNDLTVWARVSMKVRREDSKSKVARCWQAVGESLQKSKELYDIS